MRKTGKVTADVAKELQPLLKAAVKVYQLDWNQLQGALLKKLEGNEGVGDLIGYAKLLLRDPRQLVAEYQQNKRVLEQSKQEHFDRDCLKMVRRMDKGSPDATFSWIKATFPTLRNFEGVRTAVRLFMENSHRPLTVTKLPPGKLEMTKDAAGRVVGDCLVLKDGEGALLLPDRIIGPCDTSHLELESKLVHGEAVRVQTPDFSL